MRERPLLIGLLQKKGYKYIYCLNKIYSVAMSKIPKIKRLLSSFLTEEEGKISKNAILVGGGIIAAVTITSRQATAHTDSNPAHNDSSSVNYISGEIRTTHSHYDPAHTNHGSHSSHGSHGSHNSHGSTHGNSCSSHCGKTICGYK